MAVCQARSFSLIIFPNSLSFSLYPMGGEGGDEGKMQKWSEIMKTASVALFTFFVFICLFVGTIPYLLASNVGDQSFAFPKITGWKLSGEIQTFSPQTLFEYINGAADLYLMYDFQELKTAEYVDEKKASVMVDVYRHQTPTHAFGIYSQERLSNADFIDVGVQGYIEKNVLNFFTGSYYVKLTSFNTGPEDQEVLLTFAKKVAENLGEKGRLPALLATFPAEGKMKNSEKFIAKKFLGYSFLHSAFTADYELAGKKFKLFIIESENQRECRNIIQKYLEQTGKTGKNVVEGRHTISDPHHGEIDLYWKGRHLWGILNNMDVSLRLKYLKLFEEELTKSQQKKK